MAKYLIDETTLIDIADAIREKAGKIQKELILDETTETYITWGGGLGQIWDIADEVSLLQFGDTCIVTVDNIKYTTTIFDNDSGYKNLGNGSLASEGKTPEEYINNLPFFITYAPQDTGGGMEWVHEISISYVDGNEHTIKIEKLLNPIEPIKVADYATEINNIPDNKYTGHSCKVTINYNVAQLSGGMGTWESLRFDGFEIQNGIMQPFVHKIDLPTQGGVQGTVEFIIPTGTLLGAEVLGFNSMDAPWCELGAVQAKYEWSDEFDTVSLNYSQPYPERRDIGIPELLGGSGMSYTDLIIQIDCTQFEW